MACFHKFFNHPSHLNGNMGLLPNWECKTLIIGTFNPDANFHPNNLAQYFYGRTRNYFWPLISRFLCLENEIHRHDTETQLIILQDKRIGLTDLLISINDADVNNADHVRKIQTVKDNEIEEFLNFSWNTDNIVNFINNNQIEAVYFTKLGNPNMIGPEIDSFEYQMRIIENYCIQEGISHNRLHTPSSNGLGKGTPKINHMVQKWFHENGANGFPFIPDRFNVDDYPYNID